MKRMWWKVMLPLGYYMQYGVNITAPKYNEKNRKYAPGMLKWPELFTFASNNNIAILNIFTGYIVLIGWKNVVRHIPVKVQSMILRWYTSLPANVLRSNAECDRITVSDCRAIFRFWTITNRAGKLLISLWCWSVAAADWSEQATAWLWETSGLGRTSPTASHKARLCEAAVCSPAFTKAVVTNAT